MRTMLRPRVVGLIVAVFSVLTLYVILKNRFTPSKVRTAIVKLMLIQDFCIQYNIRQYNRGIAYSEQYYLLDSNFKLCINWEHRIVYLNVINVSLVQLYLARDYKLLSSKNVLLLYGGLAS